MGEGAGLVFSDPGLQGEISGRIEGDQVCFPMAFIRGDGEVSLRGDFFQSGERFDSFKNRWVELRGIGFSCEQGGGQVVGDSFGKDEEIGPQTVQGGFKSSTNRIPHDQCKKDRSRTDRDRDGEKEIPTGASSGLLEDQTKSQREQAESVGQGG